MKFMMTLDSLHVAQIASTILVKISTLIGRGTKKFYFFFDTPGDTTTHTEPDMTETATDLLGQPPELAKVMTILIVLIVGLFLTVWLVKRGFQNRFRKGGSKNQIQVLEARPISPKTVLYLIEVRGKKFLMAESQLEVKRIGDVEIAVSEEET